MGLPKIQIDFTDSARTALPRSERGIVLILANTTKKTEPLRFEVKGTGDIEFVKDKSAKAGAYAATALYAGAKKVIVHFITDTNTLSKALAAEVSTKYDYLVYPESESGTDLTGYIKARREEGKARKAVVFNASSPNESGIINFATPFVGVNPEHKIFEPIGDYKAGSFEVKGADYLPRIAGTLAGLSLSISSTYYALSELDYCAQSTNPDTDINGGKLILIDDGDKVKIARGVNSKTTGTDAFKKIKLIEGMDLIMEDIKKIFNDEFIGKVTASYDNKAIFINAINGIYFRGLLGTVLDPEHDNRVELDLESIRNYIILRGGDPTIYSEAELKAYPTGSTLYLSGKIRLLDALEDIEIKFTI